MSHNSILGQLFYNRRRKNIRLSTKLGSAVRIETLLSDCPLELLPVDAEPDVIRPVLTRDILTIPRIRLDTIHSLVSLFPGPKHSLDARIPLASNVSSDKLFQLVCTLWKVLGRLFLDAVKSNREQVQDVNGRVGWQVFYTTWAYPFPRNIDGRVGVSLVRPEHAKARSLINSRVDILGPVPAGKTLGQLDQNLCPGLHGLLLRNVKIWPVDMDARFDQSANLSRRCDSDITRLTGNPVHRLTKLDDDVLRQSFLGLVVKVDKESEDDGLLLYDVKLFLLQRLDITRVEHVRRRIRCVQNTPIQHNMRNGTISTQPPLHNLLEPVIFKTEASRSWFIPGW